MTDIFSKKKRSWIMSRIRSKNTKIDLTVKKILSSLKCKYLMYPRMYGSPDFIIKDKKIMIFCDGDFWHGYKYSKKKKPAKKFWRDKIEGNMKRDRQVTRRLRSDGWTVVRLWEHDIEKRPVFCIRKIRRVLDRKKITE